MSSAISCGVVQNPSPDSGNEPAAGTVRQDETGRGERGLIFVRYGKYTGEGTKRHTRPGVMQPAGTVVEITGDDDDEWGEEEEVVVWSNDSYTANGDDSFPHGNTDSVGRVADAADRGRGRGGHPRGLLIASLANLAISYNVVNVGLALKIMATIYPSESTAKESLISSAAIFGMIAGQLFFGALGDCLGRQLALCCTLLVCFVGAAGSALLTFEGGIDGYDIFQQLLFWRILLGIGAGGVYPLAATLAKDSNVRIRNCCSILKRNNSSSSGAGEGSSDNNVDTGSTSVALMFSMQGVGYLAAHLTGFVLLAALPEAPLAWRLLLGLGAVLPLVLVVVLVLAFARARRYRLVMSAVDRLGEEDQEEVGGAGGVGGGRGIGEGASRPTRFWLSVRDKRALLIKLIGTAGSWFLFDVTFYGNQLYADDVLEAVFGSADGLRDEASQDSFVAFVALPGYFIAVALVAKLGPRRVQIQGFLAMALLFVVIGSSFHRLRRHAGVLLLLYGLTFFFSNFGPNSTTFMLPSLTFPDQVRGSLNGLSAAAGKFGALLGSLMFKPAAETWGVGPVLLICALISFAGGLLTLAFVDGGDHRPILVGGGPDPDDDFGGDGVAEQELRMRSNDQPQLSWTSPLPAKSNGSKSAPVNGHGLLPADRAGNIGTMPPLGGGAHLSPMPSRKHSPIKAKRKGKRAAGMGMYARVGGEGVDKGRRGFAAYAGTPWTRFQEDDFSSDGRGVEGDIREGSGGEEGRQTLAIGRASGMEGQIEVAGGSTWDGDSDGSSDAGAPSGLVEPA